MKKAHFVNSSELTKVSFDGKCQFCPSVQKLTNYNRHIKGVHSNNYFLKSDPNTSQIRKYQCLKCNEVFTNYHLARNHRRTKHADCKNQVLFNVIVIRQNTSQSENPTVTVKKSLVRFQKPAESKKSVCLVPKSILFKCDNCQIHFTNCSDAEIHSKSCSRRKGDWNCKQCHRSFRLNDIELHQHQHKVTDRFTVYTYRNNLYGRVLNQCPDCKLYFNEVELKKHCSQTCVKSKPVHCGYCSTPMHFSSVDTHNIYHKLSDFNQDGRILVEFAKASDSASLNMKMYYCTSCKCCMTNPRVFNFHLAGKCKKFERYICRICGLLFSAKAHSNFHRMYSDLKINNLKFIRIQDRKVINPPIPVYPKCDECNVHYCRKKTARRCECTDDYKTCNFCMLKFSDLAYKIHVPLHEHGKPSKYEQKLQKNITTHTNIAAQESVPKTEELPVLLQKYEMLTNLWNILYLCQFCDIVCDSYDMMVDHCQRHYNKMESYDVTIMNCQICDIKFDGKCFDKHLSLHAENTSLNRDSFQIFAYDYTQLFSKQWLDLYGTLPKAQIDQIVNRSIYYTTRRVKMTVAQEGTPEYTLYKCGKCNKYVQPSSIPNHYKHAGCSSKYRNFFCLICHLPFATQTSRDLHVLVHDRIKEKPFRIVLFNNPEDCNFNKSLYSEQMQNQGSKKVAKKRRHSEMSENSADTNETNFTNNKTILGKLYHYYKCSKCTCCILGMSSTKEHFCGPGSKCVKCGLVFAPQHIGNHRKLHEARPNLVKSNIRLTPFEPNASAIDKDQPDIDETVNIINKCHCGLHFISEQSYQTHSGRCSTAHNVTKENCSKCGLLFDTNELFKHLCRHHSSHKQFRFSIRDETSNSDQESTKICVYKCGKCNVHFLKAKTYRYHLHHDHVILRGFKACNICGLVFTNLMLPKHITTHHNMLNCNLKDFVIIVPEENAKIERKTQHTVPKRKVMSYHFGKNFYSNVLYYCNHCSQFLISRQTLRKHSHKMKHQTNVGAEKCSQCGLMFGKWTLERHKKVHHKLMKLKRNDFILIGIKGVNVAKKPVTKGEHNAVKKENVGKKHKLYKCVTCDLHFVNSGTLASHNHRGHKVKHIHACKFCGLRFSKASLNKHHILHHRRGKFNLEDVYIQTTVDNPLNETSDIDEIEVEKVLKPKINIYKCSQCDSHYLDRKSISKHLYRGTHGVKRDCKICGLGFGPRTLMKHTQLHHETAKFKLKDFLIVSSDDIGYRKRDSKNPDSLSNRIVFEDTSSVVSNDVDDQSLDASEIPDTPSIDDRETTTSKDKSESMDVDDNESYKNSIDSRKSKDTNRFITLFENTLFKCENCDVHFLKEITLQTHICKDIHDTDLVCDLCGLKFNSTLSLTRHKGYHQGNDFTLKDFQIIPFSQHGKMFVNNYLYQCEECDVYFYKAKNFEAHFMKSNHTHTTARGKCDICGFNFSISALPKHKEIHHDLMNLNTDNFIIIQQSYTKMHTENYECDENEDGEKIRESKRERVPKIFEDSIVYSNEESQSAKTDATTPNDSSQEVDNRIYKCVNCKAHFTKLDTCRKHRTLCEEGALIQKTDCDICHYAFSAHSLPGHSRLHHGLFNLSRKDLRVIECESKIEINIAENKIEINNDENKLYRCHKCKVHFIKYNTCVKHFVICDPNSSTMQKTYDCEICGLGFKRYSLSKHVILHHETLNLSLQDLRVIEYNPSEAEKEEDQEEDKEEEIEISVDNFDDSVKKLYPETVYDNKLYKCGKCKIHFIKSTTLDKHRGLCGTKDIITMRTDCEICGLTFSRVTLIKHKKMHHDKLKLSLKDLCVIEYDESDSNLDADQNLSGVDNKLYKCSNCELHFIRSSPLECHLSRCGLNKASKVVACDICGLKFSSKTLKNHKKIHHDIMNLSLKDFRVLEQFVGNVSTDKIEDDTATIDSQSTTESSNNKSIELVSYKPDKTHTPIMSIKQYIISKKSLANIDMSLYDHRIYQCVECNVHFNMKASLMKHMLEKKNPIVANCSICGLMFTQGAVYRHSCIHHDRMNLSLEDFEIIRLDYNSEGKLEPTVAQDNTEPIASISKTKQLVSIYNKGEGKLKPTVAQDDPEPIASTSKTTPLASVSPTPETPNRTLFKCDICNIHYTNRELLLKHIQICDGSSKSDKCLICQLKFSKRSLQRHIRSHHELWKLKPKDLKIITLPSTPKLKNTYEKDTDSDSIISQSTVDDSVVTNDESTSNTVQSDDTTEDGTSLSQIKEKTIEQADESEVTQSTGSSKNDVTDDKVKSKIEIKLFKCGDCNVYFITQATCYKHILHHTPLDSKEYIECKLCGFQFKIITLHRHIMGHHSQNFNLEDVVVEEYKCNGENAPEITTYCAIDKVQSRLVSTTTESNKEVNSEVDVTEKISDDVTSNDSGDKPKVLEESTSKVAGNASVCDNLETTVIEKVPEIQKEIIT